MVNGSESLVNWLVAKGKIPNFFGQDKIIHFACILGGYSARNIVNVGKPGAQKRHSRIHEMDTFVSIFPRGLL